MLKRLTAWFLIFTVFTANFSWLLVYAGFKINQQYIAATLCENRDKPSMHCNGQCYLRKQLNKTADSQQNKGMITKVEVVFTPADPIVPVYTPAAMKKVYFQYNSTFISRNTGSVFQPPRILA